LGHSEGKKIASKRGGKMGNKKGDNAGIKKIGIPIAKDPIQRNIKTRTLVKELHLK